MSPVVSEVATHKILQIFRKIKSSHRKSSAEIGVLKTHKFHRKTPVLVALFNKVANLMPTTL